MDKKTAGLIGAVAGSRNDGSRAGRHDARRFTDQALQPSSYADLLEPIPNASALLQADNAAQAEHPVDMAASFQLADWGGGTGTVTGGTIIIIITITPIGTTATTTGITTTITTTTTITAGTISSASPASAGSWCTTAAIEGGAGRGRLPTPDSGVRPFDHACMLMR